MNRIKNEQTILRIIMKNDLIEDTIKIFEKNTGLEAKLHSTTGTYLYLKGNKFEHKFAIEIKKSISKAAIILIAHELSNRKQETVIFTPYVSPPLADNLKRLGIQFMDTAGNAYIQTPYFLIFLKGNKQIEQSRPETINRAFKAKGLQVIFALLCCRKLENESLRTIADSSDVALGTVQWTLKDLEKLGYLVHLRNKARKVIKKKELLNRWILAYAEQLRPKLLLGRFNADKKDWWKTAKIEQHGGLWGGEVAAERITRNLKPENATVYLHQPPGKLVLANKLKKDTNGNVEILNAFWKNDLNTKLNFKGLVHPILVYADLMASGDDRNLEIANQIYEEALIEFIREA